MSNNYTLQKWIAKIKKFKLVKFKYFYKERIRYPALLTRLRLQAKIKKKTLVHFIHIGKTGGTSIKHALTPNAKTYQTDKYIIITHPHFITLKDIKPGEKFFFFLRHPVDRFVSGFYSRKRKGMPLMYNEWTPGEQQAFLHFKTPNELAEAISAKDKETRNAAIYAMQSVNHIRTSFWDWFISKNLLDQHHKDLLLVGTQDKLNEDFERLKNILELPASLKLPETKIKRHTNPKDVDKSLSEKAIKNLNYWYKKDFYFMELLHTKYDIRASATIDINSKYGT
ncbi:MAG: sulfotransferase family 2 domain-containing protein [Bacteroidota bacterium]